jgi:hypothetical protein
MNTTSVEAFINSIDDDGLDLWVEDQKQ